MMSRTPRPDEAKIQTNPKTGHQFIFVARPNVVVASEMDEDDLAAFDNARPTAEELASDRWLDE